MDDKNTTNNGEEVKALFKSLTGTFKSALQKRIGFVLLIPTVLVGIVAVNYYYQYQLLKNNPQKVLVKENKELVAAISELIVLPEGEEPTIATVTDPEALKNQPFFTKAQKGDKVLIYTNNKKAVLYRPEGHKIVEVAPLNIGNPTGQKSSPQETEN